MKPRPLPILAALTLASAIALACQYTVRDIGFIDLAGRIYTLWIVTDDPNSAETTAALERAQEDYKLANIHAVVLDVRTQPEHPLASQRGLILEGPGGRTLDLGPLTEAQAGIDPAVSSPVREDILEGSISSFATIVLIESTDAAANATAIEQIKSAVAAFEAMAPTLPREVTIPLRRVILEPDIRQTERVMLWALGFDDTNDHLADEPVVAVLYGRLKLAGPVLVGEGLTSRTLASQLSLVGESCECEANRDWVNEAALPHRWGDEARRAAATALGFDPASPMVQSEALRIIQRGVLTTDSAVGPRSGQDDAMASFFGYSEITIGEPTTNAPEVAAAPIEPIEHRTLNAEPDQDQISAAAAGEGNKPISAEAADETEAEIAPNSSIPVLVIVGVALISIAGAAVILLRKPAA